MRLQYLSDLHFEFHRDDGASFVDSLEAYVIVSQREPLIEVFRRNADGTWTLEEARPPSAARIDAVGFKLSVRAAFEGVFDATGEAAR